MFVWYYKAVYICLRLNNKDMKNANNTTQVKKEVPAHIKALAAKMEANAKKFGFVLEDVTPKGYGPEN
jgi:hypothetical protein